MTVALTLFFVSFCEPVTDCVWCMVFLSSSSSLLFIASDHRAAWRSGPAVNDYGLLQFDSFDEIVGKGFEHASNVLELLAQLNNGIGDINDARESKLVPTPSRAKLNANSVSDFASVIASSDDVRALAWDGSRVFANPVGAASLALRFLRVNAHQGDVQQAESVTNIGTTSSPRHLTLADTTVSK